MYFILIFFGIISEIFYLILFGLIPKTPESVVIYLKIIGIIYIIFFLSVAIIFLKKKFFLKYNISILLLILFFAIIFRVSVIFIEPLNSNDVYRYLWDGNVQKHGINPYRYAPIENSLEKFQDTKIFQNINYPKLPTIYPPVAQIFFLISSFTGEGNLLAWKFILLIMDIFTIFMILLILRQKNLPLFFVIIYAWNPLPIVEFFINGHLDCIGLPFLLLFFWLFEKGKFISSAISFGISALVKFIPLFFLPVILLRLPFKSAIKFFITVILIILLFFIPYFPYVLRGISTLIIYLKHWEFNGFFYSILNMFFNSQETTRLICAVLLISWITCISISKLKLQEAMLYCFIGYILFSPTVFPWYLVWLIPFLGFHMSISFLSLLVLSQLSYIVLIGYYKQGIWNLSQIVILIEYIPFLFLFALEVRNFLHKKFVYNK